MAARSSHQRRQRATRRRCSGAASLMGVGRVLGFLSDPLGDHKNKGHALGYTGQAGDLCALFAAPFAVDRPPPVAPPMGRSGPRHRHHQQQHRRPQEQQPPQGESRSYRGTQSHPIISRSETPVPLLASIVAPERIHAEGERGTPLRSIESGPPQHEKEKYYAARSCRLTGVSESSPNSFSGHVDDALCRAPGTNVGRSIQHGSFLFLSLRSLV
ncbi:hypothetical protein HPB50_004437 [Hyalomma asiaticum]|uniref:Uncharacterized protein n=1 Tax=Hyalomma asiaticum TaxID=266040 RepID=A0ACB7TCC3_HYAAI|nr:hypothetical protein HPB50_004437 [Hyalomma asiaticum]